MLNYRLGTVNKKHWGFKPVFRCSKPHTFPTFSGEEKEKSVYKATLIFTITVFWCKMLFKRYISSNRTKVFNFYQLNVIRIFIIYMCIHLH